MDVALRRTLLAFDAVCFAIAALRADDCAGLRQRVLEVAAVELVEEADVDEDEPVTFFEL